MIILDAPRKERERKLIMLLKICEARTYTIYIYIYIYILPLRGRCRMKSFDISLVCRPKNQRGYLLLSLFYQRWNAHITSVVWKINESYGTYMRCRIARSVAAIDQSSSDNDWATVLDDVSMPRHIRMVISVLDYISPGLWGRAFTMECPNFPFTGLTSAENCYQFE